ncbi:hypothetical protein KSC_004250 [Ktedonobacter sp. SOSP1-52]|uniref:FAD-dependent oxidoreductase n=1 Tax=Ktedonobacter sp. SOSP1-52 TaxID=2778366 RepID=UPI0019159105|nr:FAD-dependent oxidoreductase [Ktedonobacter sp. SOSP1-52]GHO61533.1 hypothetical protein KSC_004250 [Ktedonobacter sp. SOSP1-52]
MPIYIPPTSLPIERTGDLVIVGASFAGCALAHALAGAGYEVALVESRTYPGYETTATLRPWLDISRSEPPPVVQPWLTEASISSSSDEIALHPDKLKRGLEDVLLGAGVHLYYASQLCGTVFDDEQQLRGVVVGNKSGRQILLGRAFVDATEWALLARLCQLPLSHDTLPTPVRVRRTLEFTHVTGNLARELSVPEEFSMLNNLVHVHRGGLGSHHFLLECVFQLELSSADPRGRMALEIEARVRMTDLAAYLLSQHVAFHDARLVQTSWELSLPSPWHLTASESPSTLFTLEDKAGKHTIPFAAFTSSAYHNLFLLNTAAAFSERDDRSLLLEPLSAAHIGTALAPLVERAIQMTSFPLVHHCHVRCGVPVEGHADHTVMLWEPEAPQRGRSYARVPEPAEEFPLLTSVDVLVVGGGTSGVPAALAAAQEGLKVAILEMNSGLGGTGTLGGVDSYWYGRRVGFTSVVDAHYEDEVTRLALRQNTPKWNLEARMQALLRWSTDAGIEVFFRTVVIGALRQGNTVCGVLVATPDGLFAVRARIVIDASGDGDVAAFAGARFTYGSVRDRLPLWYSLAQFAQPGQTRNNFTSAVDVSNINDYTRAIIAGRRRDQSYDHGAYVAPRESRHIVGELTHTLTDQLTLRRFHDVINITFSNYDVKGKSAADWILWGLLPPNVESEISYRALIPVGLDGILVAGKALSCTHDALAAIRMQADMQNLGAACGVAAAISIRDDVEVRNVDVSKLQRRLVEYGILPSEVLDRDLSSKPLSDAEMVSLVANLTGFEPFYIDMGFDDVQHEPMTLVQICTAGPSIVPLLTEAYLSSVGERQLLLARLLAWYGSSVGVSCLINAIEEELAGEHLPARTKKIRHAGFPPDQGAMPEICYLLFTLGMTRDERVLPVLEHVVSLLEPTAENFRDRFKGTFYYVDAVCTVAERLGSPAAMPILLALHDKEGLHGLHTTRYQTDYFDERIAYLEVEIACALARCGSTEGARILIDYLDDVRSVLAEHAEDELMAVSGQSWGKDKASWYTWLETYGHTLRPLPWLQRID